MNWIAKNNRHGTSNIKTENEWILGDDSFCIIIQMIDDTTFDRYLIKCETIKFGIIVKSKKSIEGMQNYARGMVKDKLKEYLEILEK